ncbi:MAG: 2-C-methyl-D-erythritol 4-phosphate cytidylyltransferase [Candidatus Krumholzibacteriia bacterium]
MTETIRTPIHLVLLAGGRGLRAGGAGGGPPKQFRRTGRGLLYRVSLDSLLKLDPDSGFRVAQVVVTAGDPWRETVAGDLTGCPVPWALAPAGPTRTASTLNALEVLARGADLARPGKDDLVAVHDTARPFASAELLARLATAAIRQGGAVPGIPVADTVVRAGPDDAGVAYLPREELLAVQTPQVFRWAPCLEAHRWAAAADRDFTDDGGLLAARGLAPAVVAGEEGNWKVTTEADWLRARDLLET